MRQPPCQLLFGPLIHIQASIQSALRLRKGTGPGHCSPVATGIAGGKQTCPQVTPAFPGQCSKGTNTGLGGDENPEEGHSAGSEVRMASWRLGGLCWALRHQWDEEGQRKGAEMWNSTYKGPGAVEKDEAQGRTPAGCQTYPGGSKEPLCMCMLSQSCPTLCNPMDYSPPGSFVHGIFQAILLTWVAMPSSRGSSRPRDQTCCLLCPLHGRQVPYH